MLCEELKEYGKKGEMSAGTLEIVDKLAHAIKNLDKIIEKYEEDEYSGAYEDMSRRGSYRGGSYRGGSYRDGRRSYARKRDAMGRYSSEGYSRHGGDMVEELRDLMEDAPDEKSRMEIQKLINKLEQM